MQRHHLQQLSTRVATAAATKTEKTAMMSRVETPMLLVLLVLVLVPVPVPVLVLVLVPGVTFPALAFAHPTTSRHCVASACLQPSPCRHRPSCCVRSRSN